jgi:hypothetical protein
MAMKRARLNPRKLLVATAGLATVNYALASGCGGAASEGGAVIANLLPGPPPVSGTGGTRGTGFEGVANLMAPPPYQGTVANLVAPPPPVVVPPAPVDVPDASPDAAADAAPPSERG